MYVMGIHGIVGCKPFSCLNTICVVLFGTPRWTHPHSLALTHSLCLSFALCVPNEWVEFIDDVEIDAADKA